MVRTHRLRSGAWHLVRRHDSTLALLFRGVLADQQEGARSLADVTSVAGLPVTSGIGA